MDQLSRMTQSYHTEYIISQYIGRKGMQITSSVEKNKMIETGCMWTLIMTATGPTGYKPMGDYYYYIM